MTNPSLLINPFGHKFFSRLDRLVSTADLTVSLAVAAQLLAGVFILHLKPRETDLTVSLAVAAQLLAGVFILHLKPRETDLTVSLAVAAQLLAGVFILHLKPSEADLTVSLAVAAQLQPMGVPCPNIGAGRSRKFINTEFDESIT